MGVASSPYRWHTEFTTHEFDLLTTTSSILSHCSALPAYPSMRFLQSILLRVGGKRSSQLTSLSPLQPTTYRLKSPMSPTSLKPRRKSKIIVNRQGCLTAAFEPHSGALREAAWELPFLRWRNGYFKSSTILWFSIFQIIAVFCYFDFLLFPSIGSEKGSTLPDASDDWKSELASRSGKILMWETSTASLRYVDGNVAFFPLLFSSDR